MYSQSHSLKNVQLADKRALHKGPGRRGRLWIWRNRGVEPVCDCHRQETHRLITCFPWNPQKTLWKTLQFNGRLWGFFWQDCGSGVAQNLQNDFGPRPRGERLGPVVPSKVFRRLTCYVSALISCEFVFPGIQEPLRSVFPSQSAVSLNDLI